MNEAENRAVTRFLRYAAVDTQSSDTSTATPSTAKQLVLAELLIKELKEFGIEDARIGTGGMVYASIPATAGCEAAPAIGFIAHMDTSPDAAGDSVKPKIVRYEGGDVVLNADLGIVFSADQFPEIAKYKGQEIIFTDGTTLLGADDKAGIAAVMEMVSFITQHPEVPHAKLCIAFTPDEEVDRGTENFDLNEFGAQYAYTFDGGELGGLEFENFNAATATVTVQGVGVHPGYAKDKMINAVRCASEFIAQLPSEMSPECTSGREGFLHPHHVAGSVTQAEISILIRDHDDILFEEKKTLLTDILRKMQQKHPKAVFSMKIEDSYRNMRCYIDRAPKVLDIVRTAYRDVGLEPQEEPIRGGTDGAALSARGLPCPNIFAGGLNFHGIFECLPVPSLMKSAEVAVRLAELSAKVHSLK